MLVKKSKLIHGFAIMELMVALLISALMILLSYQLFTLTMKFGDQIRSNSAKYFEMQKMIGLLHFDLDQCEYILLASEQSFVCKGPQKNIGYYLTDNNLLTRFDQSVSDSTEYFGFSSITYKFLNDSILKDITITYLEKGNKTNLVFSKDYTPGFLIRLD